MTFLKRLHRGLVFSNMTCWQMNSKEEDNMIIYFDYGYVIIFACLMRIVVIIRSKDEDSCPCLYLMGTERIVSTDSLELCFEGSDEKSYRGRTCNSIDIEGNKISYEK